MKINALEIDGYGVCSGLRINGLSDGLNVLYGPNEAGKTTLLQFIRSMLYGFSPERRQYLPPVHGGKSGGTIDVAGPTGRYEIARHVQTDGGGEQLVITAPDGTRQGEHLVKLLLSNIDEAIFNNVFAVELRELQELATLSDTEAAELLYNLTAGLDRISLVDVMSDLEVSRNLILDA
ncbi:MAG TPA: AAA family ATPase, partial [Thermoguttaceae bacterium]